MQKQCNKPGFDSKIFTKKIRDGFGVENPPYSLTDILQRQINFPKLMKEQGYLRTKEEVYILEQENKAVRITPVRVLEYDSETIKQHKQKQNDEIERIRLKQLKQQQGCSLM